MDFASSDSLTEDIIVDGEEMLSTDIIIESLDYEQKESNHICRLCGNYCDQLMPIFSDDGAEHNLSDKIKQHLPIIQVTKDDFLPLNICYQCASTLISWHEFYYTCKDVNSRLKNTFKEVSITVNKIGKSFPRINSDSLSQFDETTNNVHVKCKNFSDRNNCIGCIKPTSTVSLDYYKNENNENNNTSNYISTFTDSRLSVELSYGEFEQHDQNNYWVSKCVACGIQINVESNLSDVVSFEKIKCSNCAKESILSAEDLEKFLTVNASGVAVLKCDICPFMCEPLPVVFLTHYNDKHGIGSAHQKQYTNNFLKRDNLGKSFFQCDLCDFKCEPIANVFREHYESHTVNLLPIYLRKFTRTNKSGSYYLKCDKCAFICYLVPDSFRKHYETHTPNEFKSVSSFIKVENDSELYLQCDKCPYVCRRLLYRFWKHYETHENTEIPLEMARYLRRKSGRMFLKCDLCRFSCSLNDIDALKSHRSNTHIISAIDQFPRDLLKFIKSVNDIKCMQCDKCSYSCPPIPNKFRRHYNTHGHNDSVNRDVKQSFNDKISQCDLCDGKFYDERYLSAHKRKHVAVNKRLFVNRGMCLSYCKICGKNLFSKTRLKMHQNQCQRAKASENRKCDLILRCLS